MKIVVICLGVITFLMILRANEITTEIPLVDNALAIFMKTLGLA